MTLEKAADNINDDILVELTPLFSIHKVCVLCKKVSIDLMSRMVQVLDTEKVVIVCRSLEENDKLTHICKIMDKETVMAIAVDVSQEQLK